MPHYIRILRKGEEKMTLICSIIETFVSLQIIDRVLLTVLCVALFLRLTKELFLYWCSRKLFSKEDRGPCMFLKKANKDRYDCCNPIYKNSFTAHRNRCIRTECKGYYSGAYNATDILNSKPIIALSCIFIDWIIQLSSFILILRTLLEVKSL